METISIIKSTSIIILLVKEAIPIPLFLYCHVFASLILRAQPIIIQVNTEHGIFIFRLVVTKWLEGNNAIAAHNGVYIEYYYYYYVCTTTTNLDVNSMCGG